MTTAKEEVLDMLQNLPDTVSLDDIQDHIFVLQKIRTGLDAVRKGALISQQQAKRRVAR